MKIELPIVGLLFGALVLAGCSAPPTQTEYSPAAAEQPQPVHFFYGTLLDIRPATFEYGDAAGIGVTTSLSPWLAGLHAGGRGPAGALTISAGFVNLSLGGAGPDLPATEYTVLLDYGTWPPDPYVHNPGAAAVVVVQNEIPGEPPLQRNQRVAVRVVGSSGRVMADPLPPYAAERLAAGPLPVPLPPYGFGPPLAGVAPPLPEDLPNCTDCNPTDMNLRTF